MIRSWVLIVLGVVGLWAQDDASWYQEQRDLYYGIPVPGFSFSVYAS